MTVIGYAASTIDQDLSSQKAALRAAGCKVIRAEKRSGATTASRKQLLAILKFLHKGDVLMVTRLDRLARSICDLQEIVLAIEAKGASLKVAEQRIDTSAPASKAFLDMLGLFAEFEANLRRERQREGIAKAKAEGRYKGRPISIDVAKVLELKALGKGVTDIAKEMRIARSSVYRALKQRQEKRERQGSGGHRQIPDRYKRLQPLLQAGAAAGQLRQGDLPGAHPARPIRQFDGDGLSSIPTAPAAAGSRQEMEESLIKFGSQCALSS